MAAAATGILLLLFLLLQFLQGILLDVYLELYIPTSGTLSQYLWIIADGFLLIVTVVYYCMLRGQTSGQSAIRHEFCGVPALAMAWAMYLILVLLPRTLWLMVHSGRCFGKGNYTTVGSNRLIADTVTRTTGLDASTLDQNFFVTLVSAGTTGLLVLLTMAQQSEHGLLRRGVALDFDIAEAAFGTIDGVEYWQPFFDANEHKCCEKVFSYGECTANTNMTLLNSTANPFNCSQSATEVDERLISALDGLVGYMLMAVASTSFILPFFAIWQLQKRSVNLRQHGSSSSEPADGGGQSRAMVVLEVCYMLFDLFCINIPGFALRMYLWIELKQVISSLVTKNLLGIIFRVLLLWVKYIQPRLQKYTKQEVTPIQLEAQAARARNKKKWVKPAQAAKVADSFMTSAATVQDEKQYPSRTEPRKHKESAISTASKKAWVSTSLDMSSPAYPEPQNARHNSMPDVDNISIATSDSATLLVVNDPIRPSSDAKQRARSGGPPRQSHISIGDIIPVESPPAGEETDEV
eukprot:scpid64750/ scgid7356/ 